MTEPVAPYNGIRLRVEVRLYHRSSDVQSTQCLQCKHYRMSEDACDAFPTGIPAEIITGEFDHTHPYPGDNGVRFEPLNFEDNATAG